MRKLKYRVGIRYEGIDKHVIAVVTPFGALVPTDVDDIRIITAKSVDDAATRYIRLLTGRDATVRMPRKPN